MLDVRANYPQKYKNEGLSCPSCKQRTFGPIGDQIIEELSIESQSHLSKDCLRFAQLRGQFDLSDDEQLVKYFMEALEIRDAILSEEDIDT